MTTGSQEWSKYPFLIKSNRPGTKRGRSTAGRPTTVLSSGISDHYKTKGCFFCDSKERCRYDLIEIYPAWYSLHRSQISKDLGAMQANESDFMVRHSQ